MKKSTKAALLSCLILPGAGHLFLKSYFSSAIFLSIVLSALYVLISHAFQQAQLIADKIVSGEVPFDTAMIAEQISQQSSGNPYTEIATTAVIATWIISTLDAYRIGYMKDKMSRDS